MKYLKLKDHGIMMPLRTMRTAKRYNVPLSLVCAFLSREQAWQQPNVLMSMKLLGLFLAEKQNVHKAVASYCGQDRVTIDILQRMTYFKHVLSER